MHEEVYLDLPVSKAKANPPTLLLLQTEEGRAAYIDVRLPNGSIDLTRGLASLARHVNVDLSGRYDVIPLDKPGVARNFFSGPVS
jgi:hypothetical protein